MFRKTRRLSTESNSNKNIINEFRFKQTFLLSVYQYFINSGRNKVEKHIFFIYLTLCKGKKLSITKKNWFFALFFVGIST